MSEIRNVLLLDSEPACAELFRSALLAAKNGSFQGEWLGTLTEGIERLRKKGIWAIFVNLSLPDSQGLETFITMHAHANDDCNDATESDRVEDRSRIQRPREIGDRDWRHHRQI